MGRDWLGTAASPSQPTTNIRGGGGRMLRNFVWPSQANTSHIFRVIPGVSDLGNNVLSPRI